MKWLLVLFKKRCFFRLAVSRFREPHQVKSLAWVHRYCALFKPAGSGSGAPMQGHCFPVDRPR